MVDWNRLLEKKYAIMQQEADSASAAKYAQANAANAQASTAGMLASAHARALGAEANLHNSSAEWAGPLAQSIIADRRIGGGLQQAQTDILRQGLGYGIDPTSGNPVSLSPSAPAVGGYTPAQIADQNRRLGIGGSSVRKPKTLSDDSFALGMLPMTRTLPGSLGGGMPSLTPSLLPSASGYSGSSDPGSQASANVKSLLSSPEKKPAAGLSAYEQKWGLGM